MQDFFILEDSPTMQNLEKWFSTIHLQNRRWHSPLQKNIQLCKILQNHSAPPICKTGGYLIRDVHWTISMWTLIAVHHNDQHSDTETPKWDCCAELQVCVCVPVSMFVASSYMTSTLLLWSPEFLAIWVEPGLVLSSTSKIFFPHLLHFLCCLCCMFLGSCLGLSILVLSIALRLAPLLSWRWLPLPWYSVTGMARSWSTTAPGRW